MANPLTHLDWSLVQSFLAVAETGSLSGAAAALGQSQPTIGRHVRALEQALGVELFQRHPRGLRLTATGEQIRPAAEEMRAALTRIALTAETEAARLEGTVRIAASVYAAHHVLPPVLAGIRKAEPAIALVLQPSDDSDNLTFREADIAVRMYRPRQLDLVTRHLGDIEVGIFASHDYVARFGAPRRIADLRCHEVVGYDRSTLVVDAMAEMGFTMAREDFPVRCDNQTVYWELVRAGCGIGFTQANVGRADPSVVEIQPADIVMPTLPVWLTTHETARRIPRIDRVWSLLAQDLGGRLRAVRAAGTATASPRA